MSPTDIKGHLAEHRRQSVEDKLGITEFRVDAGNPHMKVNPDLCAACATKPCLYVCPANNFTLDAEGRLVMSWEGCIECGAAVTVCHTLGNKGLTWTYPRGGYGVRHTQG
ncbi:MAG: ferredoxin family protein [Deltaproteobacteria bacterium]|nr:ferredoxin family protein [Deltaproteobacteria bacterium]